jgi:hypothetical protein
VRCTSDLYPSEWREGEGGDPRVPALASRARARPTFPAPTRTRGARARSLAPARQETEEDCVCGDAGRTLGFARRKTG